MSQIITYKEGVSSQIKLTSGERIMLSCAEGSVTIFKMRFFGIVRDSKIAEWKQKDLSRFMFLFGGARPDQTPFNFTVQKLTSFDSIDQLRKFVIKEPGIFEKARHELLAKRMREAEALTRVNPRVIPDELFQMVGEELKQGKVDNTIHAEVEALSPEDAELREGMYLLLRAKQMADNSELNERNNSSFLLPRYAGFWIRVGAYCLDVVIVNVLVILGPLNLLRFLSRSTTHPEIYLQAETELLLVSLVWWIYSALLESSPWQGTVGKKLLGLIVTDLDENRIGFGRATGRFFAELLSFLLLNLGVMMVGWTQKKQGLHDMLAGTLVLKKRN